MTNICYLLVSKYSLKSISKKELLRRIRSVSNDPKNCRVVKASRAYFSHYDFAVICGNFVEFWPDWLKFNYIICVPDSRMDFLILKVGIDVRFHLTVPDKSFVTPEMAEVIHGYSRVQASLPSETRSERRQIWRDRMDALLVPYRNG